MVDNTAIGCDDCDKWFHHVPMCMGLPLATIEDIVLHNGEGIAYKCLVCRTQSGRRSSPGRPIGPGQNSRNMQQSAKFVQESAFTQLHEMLKAVCASVQCMANQIESLQKAVTSLQTQGVPVAPTQPLPQAQTLHPDNINVIVQSEIREVRDRERRRPYIIIRGLYNTSAGDIGPTLSDMSQYLINKRVTVNNSSCIDPRKGLFRAAIMDDDDRKSLLSAASKLKDNSNYKNIYLNRDLSSWTVHTSTLLVYSLTTNLLRVSSSWTDPG